MQLLRRLYKRSVLPRVPSFLLRDEHKCTCKDSRLHDQTHDNRFQRYNSTTTGRCKPLRIQAVNPDPDSGERHIHDKTRKSMKLAARLIRGAREMSVRGILLWLRTMFFLVLFLLISPIHLIPYLLLVIGIDLLDLGVDMEAGAPVYTGFYPEYRLRFWGQLWTANSAMEYSARAEAFRGHGMPLPPGSDGSLERITRGLHPRRLMIRGVDGQWSICDDPSTIISHRYIAISYRQRDIYDGSDAVQREQAQQRFIQTIRAMTVEHGMDAYWLDFECLGKEQEEKNLDLYRMADVYRGAVFTVIALRKSEDPHGLDSWRSWGGRLWTFPEALLSHELRYKLGPDGPLTPITLHELANKAYEQYSDEAAIIDSYGGRDSLDRLERITLLKDALWRRGSAALPQKPVGSPGKEDPGHVGLSGYAYPAEKVYALMGFFHHRIMPHPLDTAMQALAQLSMANDNDRFVERMVSMLPTFVSEEGRWYTEEDRFGSQLWDIEPTVQLVGTTERCALVLDGCRAATIRWKNFPEVALMTTDSVRRTVSRYLPYIFAACIYCGIALLRLRPDIPAAGLVLLIFGACMIPSAPYLLAYSNSGRIIAVQPWLIGVKGALTTDEAIEHLYGACLPAAAPRVAYTPSGSVLAKPDGKSQLREGHQEQYQAAALGQDVYTLVDTLSGTLYYFTAQRPPTVCLFTGREGGLGRFVLCSEDCVNNELRKETVLRMPAHISKAMRLCDWVAIDGSDNGVMNHT
ncbi:hypothetical protein ID866_9426, partial [Astraeus odoratus]